MYHDCCIWHLNFWPVAYSSPVNSEVLAYYCLRAGKSHECYLIIQIFGKPVVFISPWDTFRMYPMFFTLNPLWTIPDVYWYTIDIWSTPGWLPCRLIVITRALRTTQGIDNSYSYRYVHGYRSDYTRRLLLCEHCPVWYVFLNRLSYPWNSLLLWVH